MAFRRVSIDDVRRDELDSFDAGPAAVPSRARCPLLRRMAFNDILGQVDAVDEP